MIATLPMYDWPELQPHTDAFWTILHQHFQEAGFSAPDVLTRGDDEAAHWLNPNLFFSQTCGYPFITKLEGKVCLVGTPHFDIEGWDGAYYSSAVVVRKNFDRESLAAARSCRFAFNGRNSLSGYRCLSPLIGDPGQWFAKSEPSGGHRESANRVADGRSDIAAIDAFCWHQYRQLQPKDAQKLRVLVWTPPLPGLPYITNNNWNADELARLQQALHGGIREASQGELGEILRLRSVSLLKSDQYGSIKPL